MDLFSRKRIRELEADLTRTIKTRDELNIGYTAARNQIEYLVRTIRQMDDIIFSMAQAADGSWKSVQPRFAQLHDQMTARKVAESNRISDILRPQLIETYKPDSEMGKQQASLPSPIDGKR